MSTITLADVEPEKADRFRNTLRHVLSSQRAIETFAQIFDGLPTKEAALRSRDSMVLTEEVEAHESPSDESLSMVQQLEPLLSIDSLSFKTEIVQAYQDTEFDTDESHLQLLYLIAVAIHDLAGTMYGTLHPDGGKPHRFKRPDQNGKFISEFRHPSYTISAYYPSGHLDTVGYWAELQILGGVVVFERAEDTGKVSLAISNPSYDDQADLVKVIAAFVHAPRRELFMLTKPQLSQFASFARGDSTLSDTILPFEATDGVRTVSNDIGRFPNIYRDKYERLPPPNQPSCVPRGPEVEAWLKQLRATVARLQAEKSGTSAKD